MHFYAFHLFSGSGAGLALDAKTFIDDGAAFEYAGRLLDRHSSCDRVEVWCGARPVASRHRDQPVLRPIEALPGAAADALTQPAAHSVPGTGTASAHARYELGSGRGPAGDFRAAKIASRIRYVRKYPSV